MTDTRRDVAERLAREIIQVVADNAVPREDGGITVKPQAAARVADLLHGQCEAVDHHGRRCARQSGHRGHHNAAALLRSEGRKPEAVEGWIVSDHWGHDMEWHRTRPEPDGIRGITRVRITPIDSP